MNAAMTRFAGVPALASARTSRTTSSPEPPSRRKLSGTSRLSTITGRGTGRPSRMPGISIFSSFFFAEIGAQLIFREVGERSKNGVYGTAFKNITKDESRHLTGTIAMMERISSKMDAGKKAMMTRQMKHGFIYLSPLLFRPVNDFWHLPKDFFQYDQKLEELAFGAGLGVPTLDERREDWMKAIERHRSKVEALGIQLPEIKEIGLAGLETNVKKGDEISATPL